MGGLPPPAGHAGRNTTAEIAVAPDGRFLYVSNCGRDDIALLAIGAGGSLTLRGHTPTGGKRPRFLTLCPAGDFLFANAVVEPGAVAALLDFDAVVQHYDVIEDVQSPGAATH